MAAEEIRLSKDLDAEFNPHVVIIANDHERFQRFADHLTAKGFPSVALTTAEDAAVSEPRPGTVFYVSFNLKVGDVPTIVRLIEQTNGMVCIVFAEEEGTKTAAKLSSAKFTQTLQNPYTEKNFLMAMQTVVKNRKAQHEKNLRKQAHIERQKSLKGTAASETARGLDHDFKVKHEKEEPASGEMIVQRAVSFATNGPVIIKTDPPSHDGHAQVQKGVKNEKFFEILAGEAKPGALHVTGGATEKSKMQIIKGGGVVDESRVGSGHVVTTLLPDGDSPGVSLTFDSGDEPRVSSSRENSAQTQSGNFPKSFREFVALIGQEWAPNTLWAVLCVSILGILICLYCLYEILYGRH